MHSSVLEEQFPRYFHWTWWELCTGYWESKSQLATYEEMPPAVSPWVVFTLLWLTPPVVSKYTLWVWSGSGSISPTTGLVVSCISEPQSSPMWGYIPQLSTPLRISPPESQVENPSAGRERTETTAMIKVSLGFLFFHGCFVKNRKRLVLACSHSHDSFILTPSVTG